MGETPGELYLKLEQASVRLGVQKENLERERLAIEAEALAKGVDLSKPVTEEELRTAEADAQLLLKEAETLQNQASKWVSGA